jgi:hypothetical protein
VWLKEGKGLELAVIGAVFWYFMELYRHYNPPVQLPFMKVMMDNLKKI